MMTLSELIKALQELEKKHGGELKIIRPPTILMPEPNWKIVPMSEYINVKKEAKS
jgi:hypothetical protein